MKSITRMVGIGIAALCMAVPAAQAQVKLNAGNIDEVIGQMTLEEKVHMVIGCGMSMGDGVKFPGTAGRTYDINVILTAGFIMLQSSLQVQQ